MPEALLPPPKKSMTTREKGPKAPATSGTPRSVPSPLGDCGDSLRGGPARGGAKNSRPWCSPPSSTCAMSASELEGLC